MSSEREQLLLRIYLQSADRPPHTPTYRRIVQAARSGRLAGATVLKGLLGVGYHGVIQHSAWSVVDHVPVIVEIVDAAELIRQFVVAELFDKLMVGGMATLEHAAVILHRPAGATPAAPPHPPQSPSLQPSANMNINENGVLLRIFIGESDRVEHRPLYEAIVQKVRELGLAGATVLRGVEGFGANSVVHRASLLEMSRDLPIVIEIVDSQEKINLLLPHLEPMVREGMITMEPVTILMYRHSV